VENPVSPVATHTSGKYFFANQEEQLIKPHSIVKYTKPLKKAIVLKQSHDWIWLFITSLFPAGEWFVRKYNGLPLY
jgi:hypothetical protein